MKILNTWTWFFQPEQWKEHLTKKELIEMTANCNRLRQAWIIQILRNWYGCDWLKELRDENDKD